MNRQWLRNARTRAAALGLTGALAVSVVVVLASKVDGYATTQVDLTTQSVWVTNLAKGPTVGRVNKQINELDAGVQFQGEFDVMQENDLVLITDETKREVRTVDTSLVVVPANKIALAENGEVLLGGGRVAVSDSDTGAIWAGAPGALGALDVAVTEPLVRTNPSVVMAVSTAGSIAAAAPGSDSLWTITFGPDGAPAGWLPDAAGVPAPPAPTTLPDGPLSAESGSDLPPVAITTVGEVPVILDRGRELLLVSGISVPIPGGATAQLQQPGPADASVLLATDSALMRVPLTGGAPVVLADTVSGIPAQPVFVAGCAHGAWAGTEPSYVFGCQDSSPTVHPLPGATAPTELVFRVNKLVVVINDRATGNTWMTDPDGLTLIDNWDAVQDVPLDDAQAENDGEESTSDDPTIEETDCTNKPPADPELVEDSFGARTGRATILPVLDNDTLSDCSASVISTVSEIDPEVGTLAIVRGGRALQLTLNSGAAGDVDFEYSVTDGKYEAVSAPVTVRVFDQEPAEKPVLLRRSYVQVEVGGSITYNVVEDFASPTGDDLYLATATATQGSKDEVNFAPNGAITYTELASVVGKREVNFTVTDGVSAPLQGQLVVEVLPVGEAKLKPTPLYQETVVGEEVTLRALDAVVYGGKETVRLAKVTPVKADPAVTLTTDTTGGTVTVKASAPGDHTFSYDVVAGDAEPRTGFLRVRVLEKPTEPLPPVAVTDVVYLRGDGIVRLDPTMNDHDPMGGVLAVQRVDRKGASGLSVVTADMHLMSISAVGKLRNGSAQLSYSVANGHGVSTGQIRVLSVPAGAAPKPTAEDITVTVRADDAVTIPIADHASDPEGDVLTLKIDDSKMTPEQGVLFSNGVAISYIAPPEPPTKAVQFSYTVTNSAGKSDTKAVSVRVTANDAAVNSPPGTPPVAIGRMFVSTEVSITLPLSGIDPDGDWVTVTSVDSTGQKFSQVNRQRSSLKVKAFDRPGLDTITYTVSDPEPWREQATGTAKILVIDRPKTADPPVVPRLEVNTRPGRSIGVDVLSTVEDTSGRVEFVENSLTAPEGWAASVEDGLLVIDPPTADGVGVIKFQVSNARGLTGAGVITARVSADAPILPPTARDIFVDLENVDQETLTATVDISTSITNPGGLPRNLVLEMVSGAEGDATKSGDRTVSIPVTEKRQVLAYQVADSTDEEGLPAKAFIVVPALSELELAEEPLEEEPVVETSVVPTPTDGPTPSEETTPPVPPAPPVLISAQQELVVAQGATVQRDIAELVTLADGQTPTIVDGSELVATAGSAGRISSSQLSYTAPDDGTEFASISLMVAGAEGSAPVSANIDVVIKLDNPPPVELSDASLDVEPGVPAVLDLAPLAVNVLDGVLPQFSAGPATGSGVTASLVDSVLTVSVDLGVAEGTPATIPITVSDGVGRQPATAVVSIYVVASSEAPLSVIDLEIKDARPGEPSTVNLLEAVTDNPFEAAPTVESVGEPSGGDAEVSLNGTSLTITPSADFSKGTITIPFTLADETGAESRFVESSVEVIVKSVPDPPGTPSVVNGTVASHTLELKWTAPEDNGFPIDEYQVTGTPSFGSGPFSCSSSPCALTGLENNVQYTFTVTAHNELGWGEPSGSSGPATPDEIPQTPVPPTVAWNGTNTSLDVSWVEPPVDGSPMVGYLLEISTADVTGRTKVELTGTNFTWDNLAQGQEYSFQVTALNTAGKSAPSGLGDTEVPSVVPAPPTTSRIEFGIDNFSASGNSVTVSWGESPDNGGREILGYQVTLIADGVERGPVRANLGESSMTFTENIQEGVLYTARVQAENVRGPSQSTASEGEARPFRKPNLVSSPNANAIESNSGIVDLSWGSATGDGRTVEAYEINGGGSPIVVIATAYRLEGLPLGVAINYSVKACYAAESGFDSTYTCSDPAPFPQVVPYGPLDSPVVTVNNVSGTVVNFAWSFAGGNGREVVERSAVVDGVGAVDPDRPWSGDAGYDATRTLRLHVCVSGPRDCRDVDVTSPNTGPRPSPRAITGRSGNTPTLTMSNHSGGRFAVRCWNTSRPEDHKWPDAAHGIAGNYLGEVNVNVPSNGTVSVSCPSTPQAGTPFQLEITNSMWAEPITW